MDLDTTGMQFTRRWFLNRNLATFREFVHPAWAGKPITYVELGVFEGMSMCWMLQRVLTHPAARAIGVDPWLQTTKLSEGDMELVKQRAFNNVGQWSFPAEGSSQSNGQIPSTICITGKCELYRANSAEILRRMVGRHGFAGITKDSVDLCMVDGNHNALAVLDDLRLVHQLMKIGGWILLDDVVNDIEKKDHVRQGLDMWLAEVGDKVVQVWAHKYMEAYEVKAR
jgi:hypothetical protein